MSWPPEHQDTPRDRGQSRATISSICLAPCSPLRFRNFRLLWIGLIVSFTGSFMQQAAILWHVSLLAPPGQKGLALGIVGLVRAVPIILFSMVAGVAADAFDRRKLMLITQIGARSSPAALSILAFAGVQRLWPVYALAASGRLSAPSIRLPGIRWWRRSCRGSTCRAR